MHVLETSKLTRNRLRSLAAIGIVVASTFVRVFPFSSQLIASMSVVMITWFQDRSWFSAWFRSVPARRVLIGSLLGLAAIVTTDLMLLRVLPLLGLPNVDFSRFHHLRGDRITTAAWIAGVWLLVAPSEELISRGFLINQQPAEKNAPLVLGRSSVPTADQQAAKHYKFITIREDASKSSTSRNRCRSLKTNL